MTEFSNIVVFNRGQMLAALSLTKAIRIDVYGTNFSFHKSEQAPDTELSPNHKLRKVKRAAARSHRKLWEK